MVATQALTAPIANNPYVRGSSLVSARAVDS